MRILSYDKELYRFSKNYGIIDDECSKIEIYKNIHQEIRLGGIYGAAQYQNIHSCGGNRKLYRGSSAGRVCAVYCNPANTDIGAGVECTVVHSFRAACQPVERGARAPAFRAPHNGTRAGDPREIPRHSGTGRKFFHWHHRDTGNVMLYDTNRGIHAELS